MTAHMLVLFAWFFVASWVQNTAMLGADFLAKGVHAMRKLRSVLLPLLLVAGLFAILPRPAMAQDQEEDPPGRVARLSYMQGSVSYQVSGDKDWVQADPNRPLTTGDNLWADQNSRGEVHIGSTAIRLSNETGISFLNLDDRTAQIQLAQGTIEVHLRHSVGGDAWEFDTPNLAFTLTRAGEYLISADPNSNTTVIVVREGEGTVTGGGESYDLRAGQQYIFTGTDQLGYDAQPQPGFDDFEAWCQSRDQLENNSASAHYVSRDVDGYYDLDNYGTWSEVPDYGPVWIPQNVEVGWAPYHVGHWVWIAPWGWTWVDAEPWGWAPFHYGRWVLVGAHWGWLPGPVVVRPYYAPALVGFVGGGFGFSVSFGGGFAGVGWFPLGPRDVWVPGYHCSPHYFQTVNVTNTRVVNVTQVTNVYNTVVVNNYNQTNVRNTLHYTYETNERAVTAVSRETFVNARPVNTGAIRLNTEQITKARIVESAPIAPTRTSYVSSTARITTAKPAVPLSQRPVVAKLPPAAPARNVRPPVYTNDSREFNQPRVNEQQNREVQPTNRPNQTNTPPNQPNNGGFRPFTPPNTAQQNERVNTNQNQNVNRTEENRRFEQNQQNQNYNPENTRPTVRFTPPVKAKDENYDVHPPLNQKGQAQPRTESKPAPPPKTESKPPKSEGKPHGRG
jgi:hypothetical protein